MREADSITRRIEALGVLPVIEIGNQDRALPLAAALEKGGVDALEVTLRTDTALESIRILTAERPDMLVGAGTVLSPGQADDAMAAGAAFIVTPGYNPRVVGHCIDQGYPIYPGVDSASGIELALEAGLKAVKFFPATALGGMPTLASMAAPFKGRMRFIPLGGLSPDNVGDYAVSPLILAVGGTWIAKAGLVRDGAFARIEANARQALQAVHGLTVQAVRLAGGNGSTDPAETLAALSGLGDCLVRAGFGSQELPLGAERGEIRLGCNNPGRTAAWLRMYFNVPSTAELVGLGGRDVRSHVLERPLGGFRLRLVPNTLPEGACSGM